MKKLLLLGGLRYLLPVIKTAHEMGHYVITCDNVPNNIAHKYADEHHNVSILDKDEILSLAQKLQIDGIMSFAVDPGVLTAAFVAEKMNLPFAGSYESVRILQNKDLFRKFLTDHNFTVPASGGYANYDEFLVELSKFTFPIIVKPVDSAGSKGVTRVDIKADLLDAFNYAKDKSFTGRVIVEDFIEQLGCSSDSDCFSYQGQLKLISYSDQMFDKDATNPYTPAAYIWPNTMTDNHRNELSSELQRLANLLKLNTSIYNIETRVGKDGRAYIMEVSPRGGGNRISEILGMSTGINIIKLAVQGALNEAIEVPSEFVYNGVWAELILYSDRAGKFEGVHIDSALSKYLIEEDVWVKKGDIVHPFTGANETIGTLIFRFNNRTELDSVWGNVRTKIKIEILD